MEQDCEFNAREGQELRAAAFAAWSEPDPARKLELVHAIEGDAQRLRLARAWPGPDPLPEAPGRPERPRLVDPRALPQRGTGSASGLAALLHAIAHIEFNAINLALDAVWRFPDMPAGFYGDWLSVAVDEARHFAMLRARLLALGHDYGDFDAHDGLWQMAHRTRADPIARMALVPGIMEARGLDATPPIQRRLRAGGDEASAQVLQVILDEEVRHVAVGRKWFEWLCERAGLQPVAELERQIALHGAPRPRPPLNVEARLRAGFSVEEIRAWQAPRREPVPPREA